MLEEVCNWIARQWSRLLPTEIDSIVLAIHVCYQLKLKLIPLYWPLPQGVARTLLQMDHHRVALTLLLPGHSLRNNGTQYGCVESQKVLLEPVLPLCEVSCSLQNFICVILPYSVLWLLNHLLQTAFSMLFSAQN